MLENSVGWEFPSTGGGREDGLNDSGISFFKADPVKSMTREVIQDALDAKFEEDVPVIVEFEEKKIEAKRIPDIDELRTYFKQAENYFAPQKNETHKFFRKALEIINDETISICAIRDRNTIGLTRVLSSEDSHFHRLTKTTGDTGKTGTSNGSYGIGKHAPFATSFLRTMLYGTLNREKTYNRGFQGVIKIASFSRGKKHLTQGTGFYGVKEDFKPLTDLSKIDNFFKRTNGDYGTDKFIIGFNAYEGWNNVVIEEAVSSYMYSILKGNLEVIVNGFCISASNLDYVVEYISEVNPDSKVNEFYLSLTSPNKIVKVGEFLTEDGTIETVTLYLIEGEDFHNKISLNRGTGMKIYEKGNFRTPLKFGGTLIIEGTQLNQVLRLMEPPTHDAWTPSLYEKNVEYATKLRQAIYAWLNKVIREVAPKFDDDSFELPGLENILPSLSQDENPTDSIKIGEKHEKIKSLVITNNSMTPPKKRRPKGSGGGKSGGKNGGKSKPSIKNAENKARVKSIRAFCTDPKDGVYKILINSSQTGNLSFKVNVVGESVVDVAHILQGIDNNTGNIVTINENNVLGPIKVEKNVQHEISIKLDNITRYSLEVEQI
ncbi:hypothetical protein ACIQ2D_04660 [Lysinibacillus sp. NPDC097287]|uniref:hypothetical protein n=1 Tax=Lysinibacillus sp. NPDC097287 TaxID=3364144 RepID=UPI003810061E